MLADRDERAKKKIQLGTRMEEERKVDKSNQSREKPKRKICGGIKE